MKKLYSFILILAIAFTVSTCYGSSGPPGTQKPTHEVSYNNFTVPVMDYTMTAVSHQEFVSDCNSFTRLYPFDENDNSIAIVSGGTYQLDKTVLMVFVSTVPNCPVQIITGYSTIIDARLLPYS